MSDDARNKLTGEDAVEDVVLSDNDDAKGGENPSSESPNKSTDALADAPPPAAATDEDPYAGQPSSGNIVGDAGNSTPPPPPPKERIGGQKFVLSETGTEVYVTQSPTNSANRKLLILLTNSLGLASENNLALADMYSKRLGIPVIVPDMFEGDPIPTHGATIEPEEEGQTLLDQIKSKAAGYVKGFLDEMWLAKHTFERTYPRLAAVVAEIVEVYKPTTMAVVGYSLGGRYVMHLLEDASKNNDEWSSDEDLVVCGASIHPTLIEEADFDTVSKPLYLITNDQDELLPDGLIQKGVAKLSDRNVKFDRMTFGEGEVNPLPHGFAVPGDYKPDVVGDKPEQVLKVVSNWLQEHL